MRITRTCLKVVALVVGLAACGSAPKTTTQKTNAEAQANAALEVMFADAPELRGFVDAAYGYVVIPEIGKGGFIVGGAHGRGVLYVQGLPAGYVELSQASIGAQLGGQTYSELIVFRSEVDVARLKAGKFSLGGDVSAVVLTTGAAAAIDGAGDVAVFVKPRGGLMVGVTITGQKLEFTPRG